MRECQKIIPVLIQLLIFLLCLYQKSSDASFTDRVNRVDEYINHINMVMQEVAMAVTPYSIYVYIYIYI